MQLSALQTEVLLLLIFFVTLLAFRYRTARHPSTPTRRRIQAPVPSTGARNAPKPPWVHKEVLRLKALMPLHGCRKISIVFNHLHQHRRNMTVGKTFVATVLRQRQHELAGIRRQLKHRKPKAMPPNIVWALDLTYIGEPRRKRTVLGLLDHGSRACLALSDLRSKTSIAILRAILDAIELFGRPRCIRTDNESVFTSKLFRLGLLWLGIRHQRTAPFAPWQNGRVERFFKTFKELVRRWPVQEAAEPQEDLDLFRLWYNHVRPHQHLDGLTPAQQWNGKGPDRSDRSKKACYFSAWDGLLTGFYFPS